MKYRLTLAAIAALTLALAGCNADSEPDLDSDESQYGYAIGWQVGQNMRQSGQELEAEATAAAIRDALSDREPRLDEAAMQAALQEAQERERRERAGAAEENRAAGEAFMEQYREQDGVETSPEGLAWRVLEEGDGPKPEAGATVLVHYEGTTVDGEVFDSSYERGEPVSFPTDAVIDGWQLILPQMPEGSVWEVVIPADLAYGDEGAGGAIGAGETLIFEIELLDAEA